MFKEHIILQLKRNKTVINIDDMKGSSKYDKYCVIGRKNLQ